MSTHEYKLEIRTSEGTQQVREWSFEGVEGLSKYELLQIVGAQMDAGCSPVISMKQGGSWVPVSYARTHKDRDAGKFAAPQGSWDEPVIL